ncbi:MAG: sigma-70 family RNA polymerase sigma factor [Phycisphaerae bacterium]
MLNYTLGAVAELASQLRRSPVRLRLRHLLNLDFLLSVIEPGRDYPLEFIVHTLTGFRPRANGDDTRLFDAESLRIDLATLAEDLSESADIDVTAWPEPLFSVADLARRFDVSTKTIFRWRRRGLVGWKFRHADQRLRLAFPERCVRRFVAENADLVHRGSSFSQLTKAEREAVLGRARELVESGERTVNAVARTVARETGRAVETIRLILKAHDAGQPRGGLFNRTPANVPANDQRLTVWEAYLEGQDIATIATRLSRPVAWVYRTVTQMRAAELRDRKIEFIPSDEFDAPDAQRAICDAPAALAPNRSDAVAPGRVPSDLPPYLRQLFHLPLLTAEGEAALFRKLNYLKYRADQARLALDPETATASELDDIEALVTQAADVKTRIVQANLRLVVSIAKRHVAPGMDFFDLISDGNVSLMRAVDKFDYSRGFKFSTYASWAIIRNFARTIPDTKTHRERYQTGRTELLDVFAEPRVHEPENDFLPAVRGLLDRMMHTLDDREQRILRQRFGLDDNGEPQTLEQIGQRMGVSKERVRQLEARAIAKLRSGFDTDAKQLLGAAG